MTAELNIASLSTGLIGGLALFLLGMDILSRALKQVAGDYLKSLLARMTQHRLTGLVTGAFVTAMIQSSSVTTVLLVGFISAGLMTTAQSVPIILGANIGSTFTAQVLSFKLTALALPLVSIGFFTSFLARSVRTREAGRVVLGLGLVFFGIEVMSDGMSPLRNYEPFFNFMAALENPLLAAAVGAAFTALIQSSAVTTGILIVLAGQGLIGLEAAIAVALGANIGTCITALLAAIGKPRPAVRAALVHTIFNVAGVLIWIGFTAQLAELAILVTPDHPNLTEAEQVRRETPRQLANVHTLFNVANAFLFLPFTRQLTQLVEWLVPDRVEPEDKEHAPRHLDPKFLTVPAFALDAVRLEILHLGELVRAMLAAAMPAVTTGTEDDLDRLHVMDRPVDLLHREIVDYLRQMSSHRMSDDDAKTLMALVKIANDLEHVGDLVATGLVTSARKRLADGVVVSPATASIIEGLHAEVLEALDGALVALEEKDGGKASDVRAMKAGFAKLVEEVASHEVDRLRADAPQRLLTYTREIDLTETLDDIFKITRRIARTELLLYGAPADT